VTLRCKFVLRSITDFGGDRREFTFDAIYSTETPEDKRFTQATPHGTLKILATTPHALEHLKIGRKYYLDLSPVPDPSDPPANPADPV